MFDKYIMHNIQFKDYKVNRARKKNYQKEIIMVNRRQKVENCKWIILKKENTVNNWKIKILYILNCVVETECMRSSINGIIG